MGGRRGGAGRVEASRRVYEEVEEDDEGRGKRWREGGRKHEVMEESKEKEGERI